MNICLKQRTAAARFVRSRFASVLVLCSLALSMPSFGHGQTVKWNPGHYARITGDTPAITGTAEIGNVDISSDAIKGVVIRMRWNQLEGATADDYSPLDDAGTGSTRSVNYYLNFLKPLGKHLIIELRERNYATSSSNNNDAVPAYLSSYVVKGDTQNFWMPNYGDSYVIDRYIALLGAISSRFNGNPYFEGFQSGEQAIFTGSSTWRNNFVTLAQGGKRKFTHTLFWAPIPPISTMSQGQIDGILVDAKAGMYIIDSPPHAHTDGWNAYAAAHPDEFPVKSNGEVAKWDSTDDDDPASYYDVAVNINHAHHVAWTASQNSHLRSDWWDDVVPYLYNTGNIRKTNTRLPATIKGDSVVNGGFEQTLDVEWTADTSGATAITRQSSNPRTGTYALRAIASGSYGERGQNAIPVTAGLSYTISHSIRVDSVSGNGFSFKYDWFDEDGQIIGSTISQDQSTTTASAYVTKTVTDVAPTGAATLRVRCVIRSGTTSGTAYFDDISVRPNLVLNSGFEVTLSDEWTGASQLTRQSGNAHTGSYALKAVANGSYGERVQLDIPVNEGQTYTIGGWIRVDSLSGTGFSIKYDWLNSAGSIISGGTFDQLSTTGAAYVQKVSSPTAAPTGAVTMKVRCIIKSGTTTGTAYFDDISVY